MMSLWTMVSMTNYVNMYHIKYISTGKLYTNIAMLTLAEFSGFGVNRLLYAKFGTKPLFMGTQIISLIGALSLIFFSRATDDNS